VAERYSILLVDDEPVNIRLMTYALQGEYDIQTAADGFEAISRLKEQRPDMILLDVMMPELSGFDVCSIIKTDTAYAEIPIIFLTALDSVAGELEGLELGGIDYLTKPINFALLRLRVRNHFSLLEQSRLVMQQRDLLASQNAELEKKNTELECFTYTVSHDLKSPLVTIQTFAGMVIQDVDAGNHARIPDSLRRITATAARMTDLLDDLLDLSRIGRQMNEPARIDMQRVVSDTLLLLAGCIKLNRVEVLVQPDLPPALGDRNRITEVVQNLIENAIRNMGDQAAPRIEIGVRQMAKESVFIVSDNGAGIEARFHKNIFKLFNKLHPGSEGTGVGLALVKRIIDVHGGRVWVESEGAGKGSTFCFTLPVAVCKSRPEPTRN